MHKKYNINTSNVYTFVKIYVNIKQREKKRYNNSNNINNNERNYTAGSFIDPAIPGLKDIPVRREYFCR